MLSHVETMNCVVNTLNAVDVSEAYSPPRIVEEAIRAGLDGGSSMDLTNPDPVLGRPFDFSIPGDRQRASERFKDEDPICTHTVADVHGILEAHGHQLLPHGQGSRREDARGRESAPEVCVQFDDDATSTWTLFCI